jgi:DNA-binding MarR family transcriptional regulator
MDSPSRPERGGPFGARAPAFLLAQVGDLAATRFAARLAELNLMPQHAGVLRLIAASEGVNQQTLGQRLGIFASRLVTLIDQLEQRGLVERRRNPEDRRQSALYLTPAGWEMLRSIGRLAVAHQEALLAPLAPEERAQLAALLARLAEAHGLVPGVHPGFARL